MRRFLFHGHQVVYGSPDQVLVYNHALLLFGQYQQGENKVLLFMADIDEFLVPKASRLYPGLHMRRATW